MQLSLTRNNHKNHFRSKTIDDTELISFSKSVQKDDSSSNNKSNLVTLLEIIKNFEVSFFTTSQKPSKKDIKTLLIKFNQNLNYLLKEQNSEMIYLKKAVYKKRLLLQSQIFIDYRNDQKKNNKYKKKKGKKINLYNLNSELGLLKLLNFKAENDIKEISNIILKTFHVINNFNSCMDKEEKIFMLPKYYPIITKILKKEKTNIRNIFKKSISDKKIQNAEIEKISIEILHLKNSISSKKIGDKNNKEKIKEEEIKKVIKHLKINKSSNDIINSIIAKYNIKNVEEMEEQYNDNIIIIDSESCSEDKNCDSSSLNSSTINSNSIEEERSIYIKTDIEPKIKNINLNLNLTKIIPCNENMQYNSERNSKNNISSLYNSEKTKELSSQNSLHYLMINPINDKANSKNITRNNKKIMEIFNSDSKEIIAKEYTMTIH